MLLHYHATANPRGTWLVKHTIADLILTGRSGPFPGIKVQGLSADKSSHGLQ